MWTWPGDSNPKIPQNFPPIQTICIHPIHLNNRTMTNQTILSSPISSNVAVTAPPGTDIWRKPPSRDSFNAPIRYRRVSLPAFKSAKVTVKADWKTLYDQGGLCLVLPGEGGVSGGEGRRRWIKTGIELTHGRPHVSTVACDRWVSGLLWFAAVSHLTI